MRISNYDPLESFIQNCVENMCLILIKFVDAGIEVIALITFSWLQTLIKDKKDKSKGYFGETEFPPVDISGHFS